MVVDLHKNNQGKTSSVHRIVAEAFLPNPDNLPCVNHKDGNKYNNCVDNLEWCTYTHNNIHALKTGLRVIPSGTKNKMSKLSYEEVVEIKKSLILGDSEYGARPLSVKYGVDHNVILDIYHDIKYKDVVIPYTLFVCSDIHSAYTPWKTALTDAGFNPNKYSHKIVLCGDLFDRMDESLEVYRFTQEMIDKNKLIYVKGNHEQLILDCCRRGFPYSHDMSNGTAKTINDIASGCGSDFSEMCSYTLKQIQPLFDIMVNYFETEHYIFVHSWIPVINEDGLPAHYTKGRRFSFNPDWRNASQKEWDDATWGNPFDMAARGFNQTGKTIVFGHWATEHKWAETEGRRDFDRNAKFDIYYGDGIIGIDGCTAYSKKVNVLVLEDEFIK
jgi:serine/threonine protein phosphatase 1